MERNKRHASYVKVTYKNQLPAFITFHSPKRKVALQLISSFQYNDCKVFVYYTGNLLGGRAGRQREYGLRYIDNGYKLFINLSDTMLIKNYDNIDLQSGNEYHYTVNVYTKKQQQAEQYFLLQTNTGKSTGDDSLYRSWNPVLRQLRPEAIRTFPSFPPD